MMLSLLRPGRRAALAVAAAGCAACSGGGGDAPAAPTGPFDYATTTTHRAEIAVTVDALPAPGARVQVLGPLPPLAQNPAPEIGTELFATGLTGPDGRIALEFSAPGALAAFDVTVQLPGASGPLAPAGYADLWGPFAPSARVRVPAAALGAVQIPLVQD